VVALTEGVLKSMLLTNLKIANGVLLSIGLLGTGAVWLTHQALADTPADKAVNDAGRNDRTEVRGLVKAVDASQKTIVVHHSKEFAGEKSFTLAGDAKVLLDDGTGERARIQEGKLADLAEGISVTLRLSADKKVSELRAEGPIIQGTLKSVDAAAHRITATVALMKGEPATDTTFDVAKNAKLFIDDAQVTDKSKPAKQPGLADLPANAVVFLKLAADRKVVGSIRAEGQSVTGLVKAVESAKNTITVTISTKGQPDVDRTFPVAKVVQMSIDDGKPKDKTKPAEARRIADLPTGAQATLRLSLDGLSVVAIRAEGGDIHGTVKAVDAAKNTLTLHDKLQGEKTYGVTKDAGVYLDGKREVKRLADVPVEAVVDLKLLVDQKTAREIRASGPTLTGSVAGDAGNDVVTVRHKEGEKTLTVARDARILIVDKKEGTLADLIDGTAVQVLLSVDQARALELHAEGPSFQGTVKDFDPAKLLITLTIGAKNGMGGEDKEFKLTKETVVLTGINGVPLKPTDLRPDREVVLRLSIDQKAAARITVLGE
jgi:hypothetical protein